MSYSSAVDLALDIVSRNLERLQHSAWEAKAKFGYELSETVILCLEYCPGLRELIKEAWPDVESGVSEIREQGLQPICMGAIKRGEFHDFMNGTISDTKLPDTPLEEGKVRLFVVCQLGFIWLQIEPKPEKRLLA